MTNRPCKIAVAGTHSTGKSTFMRQLRDLLQNDGLKVEYVHDSAQDARDLGFPILTGHTFESTAWMMAQAIRLETVASLTAEVILVDRPVPDALGYLLAALKVTGRQLDPVRMERLLRICEAWVGEYDLIFVTELNRAIPIGPGRDDNEEFRIEAGEAVARILGSLAPEHSVLRSDGVNDALALAKAAVDRHRLGIWTLDSDVAIFAQNAAGPTRIGLGCMALTGIYGAVPRDQAIATIHAALDSGIRLFDTAPLYAGGENERLIGVRT